MPDINPSLPIVGQPDSSEEPKVVTALTQLIAAVNDVDTDQIADGTIVLADLATALQEALTPAGTIQMTAGSTADDGYLLCDGSAVSRATYPTLYARIGDSYGAGDGSTTFNLPDLQGRMPVGKGTHTEVDTLGESDGLAVGSRKVKHRHGVGTLAFRQTVGTLVGTPPVHGGSYGRGPFTGVSYDQYTGDIAGEAGDTTGPLDGPAYQVVNFQIKT